MKPIMQNITATRQRNSTKTIKTNDLRARTTTKTAASDCRHESPNDHGNENRRCSDCRHESPNDHGNENDSLGNENDARGGSADTAHAARQGNRLE